MKPLITVFLVIAICFSGIAQDSYTQIIQSHRDSTDTVFAGEESILKAEDIKEFHGLPYYPIDEDYKVKFKFKKAKKSAEFEMQTSTDRLPVYKAYGMIKFKVNGKKCKLTVYQNVKLTQATEYADYLFIPFTDLSDEVYSYSGGRYIDMTIDELAKGVIDFNLCYNPYCAYNDRYSCPIPPAINHLKVQILAGAQKWHD